jgi:hypothetical protein
MQKAKPAEYLKAFGMLQSQTHRPEGESEKLDPVFDRHVAHVTGDNVPRDVCFYFHRESLMFGRQIERSISGERSETAAICRDGKVVFDFGMRQPPICEALTKR